MAQDRTRQDCASSGVEGGTLSTTGQRSEYGGKTSEVEGIVIVRSNRSHMVNDTKSKVSVRTSGDVIGLQLQEGLVCDRY